MKQGIKILITVGSLIALCGCSSNAVDNAYSIASDKRYAVGTDEEESKEPFSVTYQTVAESNIGFDGDSEKQKQDILKYRESCQYGDFSFVIEDVLLTDNANNIKQITDNENSDAFVNYLVNVLYDNNSKFESTGKVKQSDSSCLFIKVRMKNESATRISKCINPIIYNMSEDKVFSYIKAISTCAFDRTEYLTKIDKNCLFYNFEPGEEIETVIFIYVQNPKNTLKNVYMSASFLSDNGKMNPNAVPVGCYMMPLNIKDGKHFE